MKSSRLNLVGNRADFGFQPHFHFKSRPVGKCHHQNAGGLRARSDQVRRSGNYRTSFPATGPGHNQQAPCGSAELGGGLLLRIQPNVGAHTIYLQLNESTSGDLKCVKKT
jgi:hypothetical protein